MASQDDALADLRVLGVGLIVMIIWMLIAGFADWYQNKSTGYISTPIYLPAPTRHRYPWRT